MPTLNSNEDADELNEFLDKAQGSSPAPTKTSRPPRAAEVAGDSSDGREKDTAGRLCQYARVGPGFAPTTRTIKALPSGVFRIEKIGNTYAFVPQNVVTDNLLRLPDSKSEEVIAEIERFWTLKDLFKQYGFIHKRGFLLWGPPGSGKTSTVNVVSKQMVEKGGLVVLGSTAPSILADMLNGMREVESARQTVVILEDIDTIIREYGEQAVLALLDGEMTIDNVVFIATTNYPENLDGRIVNRPSRFDKIVKIGMPSAEARELYLRSRNIPLKDGEFLKWAEHTNDFSIAQLKELIVGVFCFEHPFEQEVKRLQAMSKKPRSSDFDRATGFDTTASKGGAGFNR